MDGKIIELLTTQSQILEQIKHDIASIKNAMLIHNLNIEEVKKDCGRMDKHIDMVETTYNNLLESKPLKLWSTIRQICN